MASSAFEVFVKLPTGRFAKYEMKPCDTVRYLCHLIAVDESLTARRIRLKYQGNALEPSRLVSCYKKRPEMNVKAEYLEPKAINFQLELPEGNSNEIDCTDLDSMESLFEQVALKAEVEHHNQLNLKCGRRVIRASPDSILESGLETGSTITVSLKVTGDTDPREEGCNVGEINEEDKDEILASFQNNGKQVDVVFSFDTTGSMYSCLEMVRSKLRSCCTRLLDDIPGIRIGLIAHGDYFDQETDYVLRSTDLTDNVETLQYFAMNVPSTSGGDPPECYEWVLRKAQNMNWSEDSAKALVVIGDFYPHPPSYTDQHIKWRDELNVLKGMGVKVYGVQANDERSAALFYAEISDVSGGKHLSLRHFDIITDMFLAVCYREGNEELLEEFEQEVETRGDMTEEKKKMFSMLKETKDTEEERPTPEESRRYISEPWWDHTLDVATEPEYFYDIENDKWAEKMRTGNEPGW